MFRRWLPVLVLASCGAPEIRDREPEPYGSIAFSMATKERTYGDCVAGSAGCTYIRFDYPVITSAPAGVAVDAIAERIRAFLTRPLREDAEHPAAVGLMESFLDEFRAYKAREPGSTEAWFLERKAFVLVSRPDVVSLSLGEKFYLGPGREAATFRFANVDPRTGASISLADLLRDGAEAELAALAEARFRETRGLEEGVSLAAAGFLFQNAEGAATGDFVLTENFSIDSRGLTFYYNPSEIAAPELGPTEVFLAYGEIRDLLEPDFLNDEHT